MVRFACKKSQLSISSRLAFMMQVVLYKMPGGFQYQGLLPAHQAGQLNSN
jgi:hypothetical protein